MYFLEKLRGSNVFKSLGLQFAKQTGGYFIRSLIYSFFPFVFVLSIAYFLNQVTTLGNSDLSIWLISHILSLFIAAFIEEILFRGIILQSLNMRFSDMTALVISSILFTFAHSLNPGFSFIAAFNTFLAGALLAFMYIKTRSLWFPVFFHFFWNLFEEVIIGSNVSGFAFPLAFVKITPSTPLFTLLFGNEYGFENSIFCTLILLFLFYLINKFETLNPYISSYRYKLNYSSDFALLKNENKK